MYDKVCFSNLSMPLKIVIVSSWIVGGFFSLAFIAGIIGELI